MQYTRRSHFSFKTATLWGLSTVAALGLTGSAWAQYRPTPPAGTSNVFSSADGISALGYGSNDWNGEGVRNAVDGSVYSKYLNFQSQGSGFIDTPVFGAASGGTVVTGLQLATANDSSERDPLTFTLLGSNDGGATFTQIASGDTGLASVYSRWTYGSVVTFTNTAAYKTYELSFPTIRSPWYANSMQVAEVDLYGVAASSARSSAALATPEPSSVAAFALVGLGIGGLLLRARRRKTIA